MEVLYKVALRKESVDRNPPRVSVCAAAAASLSARRAWIEIIQCNAQILRAGVALRKESVDRNLNHLLRCGNTNVALRKESVDRNF